LFYFGIHEEEWDFPQCGSGRVIPKSTSRSLLVPFSLNLLCAIHFPRHLSLASPALVHGILPLTAMNDLTLASLSLYLLTSTRSITSKVSGTSLLINCSRSLLVPFWLFLCINPAHRSVRGNGGSFRCRGCLVRHRVGGCRKMGRGCRSRLSNVAASISCGNASKLCMNIS
jgi:hypothetical protein